MPIQPKIKRVGKNLTLSQRARLLLERESLERRKSHNRIIEELIVKYCPKMIAEEQAAIKVLTLELETKRKAIHPPFKPEKEVATTS